MRAPRGLPLVCLLFHSHLLRSFSFPHASSLPLSFLTALFLVALRKQVSSQGRIFSALVTRTSMPHLHQAHRIATSYEAIARHTRTSSLAPLRGTFGHAIRHPLRTGILA